MPRLRIVNDFGTWYASVANVHPPIEYKFMGATSEEQFASVRAFSQAMAQGRARAIETASRVLRTVESDDAATQAIDSLLGTTNELLYAERLVYEVRAAGSLLEEIEAAGEALLEVIA